MGRTAGWIALHSGVAGGADVILIPEIPFDIDEVCRLIRAPPRARALLLDRRRGRGRDAQGGDDDACSTGAVDEFGHPRLGGIGSRAGARDRGSGPASRRAPRCSATYSAAALRPRSTGCWRRGWGWPRSTPPTTGQWGMMAALRSTKIELVAARRRGGRGPTRAGRGVPSTSACCSAESRRRRRQRLHTRPDLVGRRSDYANCVVARPEARSAMRPRDRHRHRPRTRQAVRGHDPHAVDGRRAEGQLRASGHADGAGAASRTSCTRASCATARRIPSGRIATGSCSRAGTPRCCCTRRCTCPATTSASRTTSSTSASSARRRAGHPEYRDMPGIEVDDRAARPGDLACGRDGARRAHARRAVQPRRPRDRRSPHLRDRLRRRPRGGDLVARRPRSPATSGSAG